MKFYNSATEKYDRQPRHETITLEIRRTQISSKETDSCAMDKVSDVVISPSAAGEPHHNLKQVFHMSKDQEKDDILE